MPKVRDLRDISTQEAERPVANRLFRLFGRPLPSDAESEERLGPAAGVPVFGLDALASTAYGPEAALTVLLVLGTAGPHYLLPIGACMILLLLIVYSSYLQTLAAYPRD